MEKEHLAQVACECLQLPCPEPDLTDWKEMVEALRTSDQRSERLLWLENISQLHDAYISVVEALKHGGIASHATVNIKWVDSEDCHTRKMWTRSARRCQTASWFPAASATAVSKGRSRPSEYARDASDSVPGPLPRHAAGHRGICPPCHADMQDAHSIELNPKTTHPVIALMPDQDGVEDIGGTLRLGSYPCVLKKDSKAYTAVRRRDHP